MSACTVHSLGTESGEIQGTCDSSYVLLWTERAFGTKASVVPLAFSPLDRRVDVKIEAVVTTVAESERGVESAFWDLSHVVFV